MNTGNLICCFSLAMAGFSAAPAAAATLDFEAVTTQEVERFGPSVTFGGVTFSTLTDSNIALVRAGGPTNGFVPNDSPLGGAFGQYFLTTDFKGDFDLAFDFGVAVTGLGFQIADIDGPEQFRIRALDAAGGVLQSLALSKLDGGDAVVTSVDFLSVLDPIARVEIEGFTADGKRNIGYGLDNLSFTPVAAVPVPAALPLAVAGFGLLGWVGWRRRNG